MNPVLRRSVAHLLVADVAAPVLEDESAHHLLRVLRARNGDTVTVTDGAGSWRACRVAGHSIDPIDDVVHDAPPAVRLTLGIVVPKSERREWLVQKATEIGIDRIVLLQSRRSVVRWGDERALRSVERLRRVAAEATQQSRRVYVPEVVGPVAVAEFVAGGDIAMAEPGGEPLSAADHTVAIGPEGGWDPDEVVAARRTVDLGDTVLRVETAALVAATLMAGHRREALQ